VQHPLQATLDAQERDRSWLARKTGKSPSYVHRVVNGERRASEDFKRRASEALGVPASLLFPPTDAPVDETDQPSEAIA
jgi:transcriptional regulator with XRE-family HTH domain